MKRGKIAILSIVLFVLFLGAVFEFAGPKRPAQDGFMVLRGENLLQIAANLKAEGYVKSKIFFVFEAVRSGNFRKMKAGKYDLKGLNGARIVEKLALGQTVPAVFTVIPGWSLKDVARNLEAKRIAGKDEFLAWVLPGESGIYAADLAETAERFSFLRDAGGFHGLEGFLYPDSYRIAPEATKADAVEKMLENFDRKLAPEFREEIERQGRTVFEIVTMASMLEKEVKSEEDKKIISGILWKREANGLALEVDSTLLYFLAGDHPGLDDKNAKSPYNTYKYGGLPEGPICNPGIESIRAAIYPVKTDYWFYLSAKDGRTIFSKTYGEHLINKAKYLDNQ